MSLHQVDQLGARAHVQHRRVRPRDRRLRARHPRQRERLGFVRTQRLVHDRAVVGLASLQLHRVVAADIDFLLEGHEVAPLAVEHVALALDPLDEQVHHVRHRVRERPGHVVVVAERDPERARQRRAPAEPVAQAERHLVGDAGHRRRQVRVPCNQRALCGRARRRHGPVVRARCLDRHPQEPADRVHSLGQLGAGTGGDPRRQDERIIRRVAGIELRRQLRADLARQVRAKELALPIGREPEREELLHCQGIGGGPRPELEPQQLQLQRGRRGGLRRGVDPGGHRLEVGSQLLIDLRRLAEPRAAQAERSHEPVRRKPGWSRDLGEPAVRDASIEVQLPEPVLALAEALREPQVVPGLGRDVGHPPTVAADLDHPVEAREPDRALGARAGAPQELPPEPGGRRRGQTPEQGRRDSGLADEPVHGSSCDAARRPSASSFSR